MTRSRRHKTQGVRSSLGGLALLLRRPGLRHSELPGSARYRCRQMAGTRMEPSTRGHVCRLSGPVEDYVSAVIVE